MDIIHIIFVKLFNRIILYISDALSVLYQVLNKVSIKIIEDKLVEM